MSYLNLTRILRNDHYLLGQQSDEESRNSFEKLEADSPQYRSAREQWLLRSTTFSFIYSIVITAISIWFTLGTTDQEPTLLYTPARQAIAYHLKGPISTASDAYHGDLFFGDPSPLLDARWEEHLKYAMIRLTEEEFSHYNQSGILLGDGSGYLATPTAYHDLHCLQYLHKTVYPKYYFPDDTSEKQVERDAHTRHCLHNLFYSVTCSGDMTMRIMRWHPHTILPSPVDHEHECRDWKSINSWAKERYVDTKQPGLLVHPTKGEVFPST